MASEAVPTEALSQQSPVIPSATPGSVEGNNGASSPSASPSLDTPSSVPLSPIESSEYGHISGRVFADTNNDGAGDQPLLGVVINLEDENGITLDEAATNELGFYEFSNIPAGKYKIVQTNLVGYTDVSDIDGDPTDNLIEVNLSDGVLSEDNDFIDKPPDTMAPTDPTTGNKILTPPIGLITGMVWADTDGDTVGDVPLPNVTVALMDYQFNTLQVVFTNNDGRYDFSLPVTSGAYRIVETNNENYVDVSDSEGDFMDNTINIDYVEGKISGGNDFIDAPSTQFLSKEPTSPPSSTPTGTDNNPTAGTDSPFNTSTTAPTDPPEGTISGKVLLDTDGNGLGDTPLTGVVISLRNEDNIEVSTQSTDYDGVFEFKDIPAGKYHLVQTNRDGYSDVSDTLGDSLSHTIEVLLLVGEFSIGHEFVDKLDSSEPSFQTTDPPAVAPAENPAEELPTRTISGKVWIDKDGDKVGDSPLPGAKVYLKGIGNNEVMQSTNQNGIFEFFDVAPGQYQVVYTYFTDNSNVTYTESDPLDIIIAVDLVDGSSSTNNDFVVNPNVGRGRTDGTFGIISGTVFADTSGDGVGDIPLESVRVDLLDENGESLMIVGTTEEGVYTFDNIGPGRYQIHQVNFPGYNDISDTQGDLRDSLIMVTLLGGESLMTNNFVDAPPEGTVPEPSAFVTLSPSGVTLGAPSAPFVESGVATEVALKNSPTEIKASRNNNNGLSGGAIAGITIILMIFLTFVVLVTRRRRNVRNASLVSNKSSYATTNFAVRGDFS